MDKYNRQKEIILWSRAMRPVINEAIKKKLLHENVLAGVVNAVKKNHGIEAGESK